MKKAGFFFRSLVPFLISIGLQLVVTIPMEVIYMFRHAGEKGDGLDGLIGALVSASTDTQWIQLINLIYGIFAIILFTVWYQKVFAAPFRHKKREIPSGFSFHTIMSLLFLAVGLQYVTTLVVDLVVKVNPAWMQTYLKLMETTGYGTFSWILIGYSVILAPVIEEVIFRGLIFRYARQALPFWIANIWQAFLFGLLHMNIVQGIYAFVVGLFLGWICHRGQGIKYSIVVHIIFNIIGTCFSELVDITTGFSRPLFIGGGILLTVFALWLFYTDFIPAGPKTYSGNDE